MTAELLCGRRREPVLRGDRPAALHGLLSRCSAYLKVNTGVKHIFGLLAVDSIAAAETEEN